MPEPKYLLKLLFWGLLTLGAAAVITITAQSAMAEEQLYQVIEAGCNSSGAVESLTIAIAPSDKAGVLTLHWSNKRQCGEQA